MFGAASIVRLDGPFEEGEAPVPMLIDSHCHLDLPQYDADRAAVLARAQAAGVAMVVNPGIDLDHSRSAVDLAHRYAMVHAAVGVHPNSSRDFAPETVAALRALAADDRVVAVGEIGLDYHWDDVAPAQQKRAFEAQLELAADVGLPVIIHSRKANDDVAAILAAWVESSMFQASPLARRPYAGVLHAFSGDRALAEEAYGWNFVLSLGGPVTFRNAGALHALAPHLRLDRLMLETDGPYLTPHPHRGKRNEPAYISLVRDRLADLREEDPDRIAAVTSQVALRFFGLEDEPIVGRTPVSQITNV